ncbi:hypothetical protein, partial [Paenibacillus sp. FSL H8-237]|uniref:hypothetical protein n=1 Tax=Paenibacillus sp. FSL H8-237 TaxID=1227350 RepID=UPI001F452D3B
LYSLQHALRLAEDFPVIAVAPTFFFFNLSLRDLYLPFVPKMNSALLKTPTGFTVSFFSQVLSDFFFCIHRSS